MIEFISNMVSSTSLGQSLPGDQASDGASIQGSGNFADQHDFQAMVDGDDSSESGPTESIGLPGGGLMDLVRNVDSSKATMQSTLLKVSISNKTEDIQAAAVALSRFDIQTLYLSKLGNKAAQGLDRLTNIQ